MSLNEMLIAALVVNCGARMRGCFRRWRQPVLRGPEWFFNVRVQAGFYAGGGRRILYRYRLRMLIPVAVEMGCWHSDSNLRTFAVLVLANHCSFHRHTCESPF